MSTYRIDIETQFDEAFNYYHSYTGCTFRFDNDILIIKLGADSTHKIAYDCNVIKYLRIDKEDD